MAIVGHESDGIPHHEPRPAHCDFALAVEAAANDAHPRRWLAALLFAIHPVNVESVAWISQRTEMLASLFLVLSFLWFVRDDAGRKTGHEGQAANGITGWYWLSLLAYLLAMLSKISVASMPLMVVLIIWWLHGRITKRDLLRTIPFFGVAFALILVQLAFQKHGDPVPDPSWAERFAGAGAAVWFYLAKALSPIDQLFFYPHWEILTRESLWWLPLMAVVAVTVMLFWRCTKVPSKWNRSLLFAWTFFCVALAPAVGFIQNGSKTYTLVADRYEHLAIIAVVALIGALWSHWHEQAATAARWRTSALAVAVVGVLAMLTCQRSYLFGNPVELYEANLATNADLAPRVLFHTHIGDLLSTNGQVEKSIEHYLEALRLRPDTPEAHHNLANALMADGQTRAAIEHYQQALKLRPDYAKTHCNLGIALMASGQTKEAIDQLQQAVQLDPEYADAHDRLGNLLVQMGQLPEAISHFQQAVRYQPDNAKTESNLAIALASTGQLPQSIEHFQHSLKLDPDNAATHHNLGVALVGADRLPEAVDQFTTALQIQPNRLPTLAKLTTVYSLLQQPEKAIATAEKSLELARSTGQTKLAAQIEDWLSKYRAGLPTQSGKDTSSP